MEININKEIKNYSEELVLGLNLKTCIFFGIGIGLCVLEWFIFSHGLHVKTSIMTVFYVLTAVPFGFLGVFNYNGRDAWGMIKIWFKYYFLQDHHLEFKSEAIKPNNSKKQKGDR